MAPVTRRKSATGLVKKDDGVKKSMKIRKEPPSPLKSALRPKLEGVRRARQVTFHSEIDKALIGPRLPTTPYPASRQIRRVPTPHPSPPPVRIDHTIREEQEELLRRAARALDTAAKTSNGLLTPPETPPSRETSAFTKPEKVLGTSENDKLLKIKTEAESEKLEEIDADAEMEQDGDVRTDVDADSAIFSGLSEESDHQESGKNEPDRARSNMKLTSRHIDSIKDKIPRGVKMPESIEHILTNPSADIKMEEICTAFDFLKMEIQQYIRIHFKFTNRKQDQNIPTFTQLKVKNPELFRYIQYVADGSQYGWDKLLGLAQQRELLVYAIISRALVAHVFDAELFGASMEDNETLLEMCRNYLNYDAFVRNTHRAEIILPILLKQAQEYALHDDDPFAYFASAIDSLKRSMTSLLQPLHKPEESGLMQASALSDHQDCMAMIIKTALKIHLAIRLAGSDGTVYRFEHAAKHSPWDSETMNCINQLRMDLTAHHGESQLVKISCFPAVFATVPSGPTLENFCDPTFVAEWQTTADEDGSKPLITTYPITLSDVALENVPRDHSGFLTLKQTMAHEQARMSDADFQKLTGINRPRIRRLHRITKTTRKVLARTVKFGLAAAAVGWFVYRNRESWIRMVRETRQILRERELMNKLVESAKASTSATAMAAVGRTRLGTRTVDATLKVTKTVVGAGGVVGGGRRTATSQLTLL